MVSVRRRDELVSARKAAGLTQEKLAEAMCVDRSTVIRWEAGEYAPLPYQWPKLAKVLGRSTDELRELIGLHLPREAPVLRSGLEPAFGWLDRYVGWPPGTTRTRVTAAAPAGSHVGATTGRSLVAETLASYYGDSVPGHAQYAARSGSDGDQRPDTAGVAGFGLPLDV